jgi:lysophospholipase L1-like esterase
MLLALAALAGPAFAGGAGHEHRNHWYAAWAGPQQDPGATAGTFAAGTTIRETVWVTVGGDQVRVKFSNAFGALPLRIGAASIGLKSSEAAGVAAGTLRPVTFGGKASVTIPIQGFVLSDPVTLAVPALTDVSVSIYLPDGSDRNAQYPGSRKVAYIAAGAGDLTQAQTMAFTATANNGFLVSAVEVHNRRARGVIACVGDSIVAGGGSSAENLKWSDRLAARINGGHPALNMGVLGLGIGGNRVLSGATSNPAALARLDRDVLGMAGLTHIILADGVNDLGSTALTPDLPPNADDVAYGVTQLVQRAHARGIKVIGTTMGPAWGFRNYELVDFKRLAYNQWMRTVGVRMLDGLIDFDKLLDDPANPSHMLQQYLTDGIHPNDAGHQAMADFIDLQLFRGDDDDHGRH